MKNVTIYSSPTCHFCHAAKAFFDENGIEYTDYDVAAHPDKGQEMIERSGQMGTPVIFVDDEMVIGFDEEQLKKLLDIS